MSVYTHILRHRISYTTKFQGEIRRWGDLSYRAWLILSVEDAGHAARDTPQYVFYWPKSFSVLSKVFKAKFNIQALGYSANEDGMFCVKIMANFAGT